MPNGFAPQGRRRRLPLYVRRTHGLRRMARSCRCPRSGSWLDAHAFTGRLGQRVAAAGRTAASRARCSASAIRWIRSPMRTRPSRCRRAIGRWRRSSTKTRCARCTWAGAWALPLHRYKAPLRAAGAAGRRIDRCRNARRAGRLRARARPGQHAHRGHGPGPTRTGVLRTRRSAWRAHRSGQRRRAAGRRTFRRSTPSAAPRIARRA